MGETLRVRVFWAFELFSWLSFWETPIQWLTRLGEDLNRRRYHLNDVPVLVVAAWSAALTIAEDGGTAVGRVAFADGVSGGGADPGSDGVGRGGCGAVAGSALSVSDLLTRGYIAVSGSVTLDVESGLGVVAVVSMMQTVPAGDSMGT